jgi:2'-5' RNA ligase
MKRIFIAVKVDPGQALIRIHASLKSLLGGEKINWTDPANMHLTLAFLGDTEDELIKVVSIMLKKVCTGFGGFRFDLTGAGVFRNYSEPRVIWAGIESNERLSQLHYKITIGLKDAGLRFEERKFSPHLTLGRIKSVSNPEVVRSALERYHDVKIQEVDVKEVILFESILKPTGPVYIPLGRFKL